MNNLARVFKDKRLRWLLASQVPADLSDWLDFVAVGALLAFVWKAEPVAFAFVALAMGLPYAIIGPFAGALIDRWPIRSSMFLANIGRAAATLALVFAPRWEVLVAIIFARSVVDSFYTPAKQAAIKSLAPDEILENVNGVSVSINQTTKIVAPVLGGSALGFLSPQTVFLANTFVSLIAAALVLGIGRVGRGDAEKGEPAHLLADVADGMKTVWRNTVLRSVIAILGLALFSVFIYDTLIAPMVRDLGFSQVQLGYFVAASGLGGLVGAVLFSTLATGGRSFLMMAVGAFIAGLMTIAIGWIEVADITVPFGVILGLVAMSGAVGMLVFIPAQTAMQRQCKPNEIGRVAALSEAFSTVAISTAPFLGAMVATAYSPGMAFILGGSLILAIGLFALLQDARGIGQTSPEDGVDQESH